MRTFLKQSNRRIADYFQRRKYESRYRQDKKCSDFLWPFVLEYQRSCPSAVEFIAVDDYGNELFTISCDTEGEAGPYCCSCAEKGEISRKLLSQILKQPEEFRRMQGGFIETSTLQKVANVEIRTIPSDTDYYDIPRCPYCGEFLDLNCVPENIDEELAIYCKYKSLKKQKLRLLDLWHINHLLAAAEKSEEKTIRKLARKLTKRIIAANHL